MSRPPDRPVVTGKTKLSELRRLIRNRNPTDGRARLIRSIQQSMRVEGYDVSEEVVAAAVDREFATSRSRGTRR